MSAQLDQSARGKELFGHPVGLFILFFTEMWERFSYYGMRAILVLYITSSVTGDNPGLGWNESDALALYGWYTMLVYVMSIPGGILADKFIGQKKSVMVGGLILVAGHGILAVEQMWAFYTGLALIVLGVGGLKPNISTLVGGLYKEGDIRRDKGFTIFYIGINIGAAAASLLVGYIGEEIGWHYGFGLAGIGMLLGQIVYMSGQKYLAGIGDAPTAEEKANSDDGLGRLMSKLFVEKVPLTAFILIELFGLYMIAAHFAGLPLASIGYGLLALFLGLVVGLMMVIYNELTQIEKDRYIVLLLSFIIVIVFWGAFEQAGGLMNIYTKEKVNRVVDLGIWAGEIPASVFQSVNAIFIIIFGAIVAGFWAWRKRKGGEASSLYKMAIGTIVMGVGFLFMAKASLEVMSTGQAALVWIILAYLFHTLGELSASPVALSFITKLAPARYVSIMMGVYFAATGLGNKVAGAIGEASQTEPIQATVAADMGTIAEMVPDSVLSKAEIFEIEGTVYFAGSDLVLKSEGGEELGNLVALSEEAKENLRLQMEGEEATAENPYHLTVTFENTEDNISIANNESKAVSLSNYKGELAVFEIVNNRELRTFVIITLFTAAFGLLLIVFLRKLKKLTHGVEENERDLSEELTEAEARPETE
jgi:POT family proton-dependent oligopeptide transporter